MTTEKSSPFDDHDLPVESLDEFLSRLKRLAEDWRYGDEFIGIVVRSRWPRVYDSAAMGAGATGGEAE